MYRGRVETQSRFFASVCKTIADVNRDPEETPDGYPLEEFMMFDFDKRPAEPSRPEVPDRCLSSAQLARLLGSAIQEVIE